MMIPQLVWDLLLIFLPAIVFHEFAHGWVALKCGDSTAKDQGRLTLNPLKHLDPVGSVFLPLVLFISHSPYLFGWARPVPVNFSNFRFPRRDLALVAMAGPAMNMILAVVASALLALFPSESAISYLSATVKVNLGLAIFNLLPFPPLDGSKLVLSVLPVSAVKYYREFELIGIVVVFALLSFGILDNWLWGMVAQLASWLGVP